MSSTAWPAPPAVDFWGPFTLRSVPSLRSPGRVTAPAARRERGPAGRGSTRSGTPGPLPCRGVVTIFAQWHRPMLHHGTPDADDSTPVCFAPGCFDRSLAKIRAGEAPFRLLVGHDPEQLLAGHEDGCLLLTQADGRLNLTALPFGPAGRLVCRRIREEAARGFRALSIGATILRAARQDGGMIVTRATLKEVSLVRRGAMPDAQLLL